MRHIPVETQTLFADLQRYIKERSLERTIGDLPGCFTIKKIKGVDYYYYQYKDSKQRYVGKKGTELDALVEQFRTERDKVREGKEYISRATMMLTSGGYQALPLQEFKIFKALSDSGFFHSGGTLVGSHAFKFIGNMLGVEWSSSFTRTQDIDLTVDLGVPSDEINLPDVIESLKMGFVPALPFKNEQESHVYFIKNSPMKIDFLTPLLRHKNQEEVVTIRRFNIAAEAINYLDFLLDETESTIVVGRSDAVLINVPSPARYAFHKLLVAQKRPSRDAIKKRKDLSQANELLKFLYENSEAEVMYGWDKVKEYGGSFQGCVLKSLDNLSTEHAWIQELRGKLL